MGQPITTTGGGICFAFPDVCKTPSPSGSPVPIPYPNIGQLSECQKMSNTVKAGGNWVVHVESEIPSTTGDEAGSVGGVKSNITQGKVIFKSGSQTVFVDEGKAVVRMFDPTEQNVSPSGVGNAVGTVLGGEPTVLVG